MHKNSLLEALRIGTALAGVLGVVLLAPNAYALPQGGVVNGGQASIISSSNQTTINQSSQRAILDWNSFNVSSGEAVRFNQPSASAITLNRIHDASASMIDGTLSANGNIWLINNSGIMFGKNAQVNLGGVLATTSNIDNNSFMAGNYNFTPGGNPNAIISNAGNITVADGGLAAFVAPNVTNSGVINAKLGNVTLASGDSFTVDLYGDGLINLQASPAITQQLVSNSGRINANGGTVTLTTAAANSIVNRLINMDGVIEANSIGNINGDIVLLAEGSNADIHLSGTIHANGGVHGNGGNVRVVAGGNTDFSGTIEAKGGAKGGNGGLVETSGHVLSATGNVNASAPKGKAGTWLIDPATINVVTGGSSSSLTGSTIDPSYLVTELNGTNITLTATGSITVTNAVNASGNGSAGNLILNAPTDYLNAAITLKTGSTLSGNATTVNVGASGLVQNGVDAAAAGATVNLADATYALTNEITIAKSLTVNGDGAILNGQNETRVMEIDGTSGGITVNLNKLTLENGNGTGTNDNGQYGGGLLIYAGAGSANVTINNSTISGNSSPNGGGGVYNGGEEGGTATLTINNSTISGNSAGGFGGGINNDGYVGTANLTINNSTISGNSASAAGGGILNYNTGGILIIGDTILAGNTNGGESDYYTAGGGTLTSNGYNLFGQSSNAGGFVGNGTTDIQLTGLISSVLNTTLASNSGLTQTLALVGSSPAIAAGGSNVGGYEIDQRGMARALSGQISIGAYEYNSPGNPFVVTSTADAAGVHLGQLRTALNYSNNNPAFDPNITFDSGVFNMAKTITLTQGELTIGSSLNLDGGTYGVTLDANNLSRVMEIDGTSGGITVGLNKLTLENGNTSGNGAAMFINAPSGNQATVTINNSTLSDNSAGFVGGGIFNDGQTGYASLTINNSTISGNSAQYGGAIYTSGNNSGVATLTINNSTISGNSASTNAGGIFNDARGGGSGTVTIGDTILAGNTVSSSEDDIDNYSATVTSLGHNLFGQSGNAGGFTGNGTTDILLTGNINTALASLGNYGGPTQTMALVVGSPAYLAGGAVGSVTTDQRGDARGSIISIGAYDFVPTSLVINSTADTAHDVIGGTTTTLRDALYYSNVGAISDPTITFNSTDFATPETITLAQGELTIGSSLILTGPSAGVTLNANNASRVMEIDGTSGGITVNLSDLTLENGNGVGANGAAGAGFNGNAGGLFIYSESGNHATVNISNSTFLGNSTTYGGGIMNDGENSGHATLTISNSTITGNSASYGGGIQNVGPSGNAALIIMASTISGNSASSNGGGIYNQGGALMIGDTILAGNTSGGESDYAINGGTLTSLGYNLFGQSGVTGGFTGNGTTDILLSGTIGTVLNTTLANNGGPTETLALVSGSAAIAAGGSNVSGYDLDQRGYARALSGGISIGAYEYDASSPFMVTSTADPSSMQIGTLRTALDFANHYTDLDPTITFNSSDFATPETITLAQGELTIASSLTLTGPTAGVTLNANNASRVMEIDGTGPGITVGLDRLTLENGNGSGTTEGGALIVNGASGNKATVTINNSAILDSSSTFGGGIMASSGGGNVTLTINNSTISGNSGSLGTVLNYTGDGSGVGNLIINNSTISNNGSGIFNQGTLTIGDTILAGNGSEGDYASNSGGTLTSLGYNLFGQNGGAGGFVGNGTTDILLSGAINTVLSSLGNYGGPTQTMALVVGSPAYLAGGAVGSVTTDQRGDARGSVISIGAYDFVPSSLVVNSTADTSRDIIGGSTTTLRDALYYSNMGAISNPTITFDSGVFASLETITLAQGELTIGSNLTLNGPTSGVKLDAHTASRVMEIDGTSGGIIVGLNCLTLENGNGAGSNQSGLYGGGLLIYAENGNHTTVAISNSTISGNSISGDYGGGIFNDGYNGGSAILTIINSTISANSAGAANGGGGIYNFGYGGNAALTITNSTVSGNLASGVGGGGIVNDGRNSGSATLTIGDTIVAGNTDNSSESDYVSVSGTLTSNGHNLFGQSGNAGGFVGNGTTDIQLAGSINTVLSALGDHGGPTQTMALVDGSAAYLAGGAVGSVTTDQRGVNRGSVISIGAYDYVPSSLVVNTTSDASGDVIGGTTVSLRDALFMANAGALSNPTLTFDGSVFNMAKTITLAQGEFIINSSLTLDGGTYGVTLDAHTASRLMEIDGTAGGITVGLNKLTLENGNGNGTNVNGYGGGLLVFAEGSNHATVTLSNSTISNNTPTGDAGGIFNDGSSSGHATLTINNSTISGNTAGDGAGIWNAGGSLAINDSTISGNSAAFGGGIYNASGGSLTIDDSTISGNSSYTNNGSGIFNYQSSMTIVDTILAGNSYGGTETDLAGGGTFTSNGYNLYGQNGNAGGFTGNGTTDIQLSGNINTMLNTTLANNGGPTQTLALVLGSPAIDAGDPAQISQLDQRGFTRGSIGVGTGSASDIGAYEAAIIYVSADNKEIIYGQAAPSFTYTLTGGPAGHLNGGAVALTTGETNAGTYAGDIGVGTLALTSNNYLLDFTAGQYKIDQRVVTIDPTSAQSKIYGVVDPTLTSGAEGDTSTTGLVNGNTLSGSLSYSGAGQYTNVGNYAFTLGTLTAGSNYTLSIESSPPTFAITARTVTVDPDSGQSKIYGVVDPTLTYSTVAADATTGLVNGNMLSGDISYAGAGQYTSVGNYATTLGNLTNGNYNIVLEGSPPTFAITARTVTVDPTAGQSKIYGTVDPTLTYSTAAADSTTGLVNGNTLSGAISYAGAGQYTSVGNYATTLGNLTNGNYNIVLEASPPTFGITARTVTVDPTSGQSKIYGTADPTLTYSIVAADATTGLVNGNTLSGDISYAGAGQYTGVGNYATTLGNLTNSNYNIVLEGSAPTFGITARTVTVDPTSGQNKVYGIADPTLTYSTAAADSTTGLVNSDSLSGAISYSSAGQYTSVGNYATTLGNLSNSNYNIVLEGSAPTFAITARTVTVDPDSGQSKIYGTVDPTLTYSTAAADSTTGLVNGNTLSGDISYAGAGQYTTVGNYATTLGTLANSNYNIALEVSAPTFIINPVPVNINNNVSALIQSIVINATTTNDAVSGDLSGYDRLFIGDMFNQNAASGNGNALATLCDDPNDSENCVKLF